MNRHWLRSTIACNPWIRIIGTSDLSGVLEGRPAHDRSRSPIRALLPPLVRPVSAGREVNRFDQRGDDRARDRFLTRVTTLPGYVARRGRQAFGDTCSARTIQICPSGSANAPA